MKACHMCAITRHTYVRRPGVAYIGPTQSPVHAAVTCVRARFRRLGGADPSQGQVTGVGRGVRPFLRPIRTSILCIFTYFVIGLGLWTRNSVSK